MAFLTDRKDKKAKGETVILANDSKGVIPFVANFDQKTLVDIDMEFDGKLKNIEIINTETPEGKKIPNVGLMFADKTVLVPLSRGFNTDVENDPTVLLDGRFYIGHKFDEDKDTEGEYPYSGPLYCSFGKIGTIKIVDRKSLVGVEAVAQ